MDLETKTILLADDEEEIREDLALFLEYSGYQILQARNGKEAYQLYKENVFDLIITDIEMPKLNGLELVESIRQEDQEVPILIISGYSDKDKLLRAIKLNLVDYIIKPFTRDIMLSTVENIFIVQEQNDEVLTIKGHRFKFLSNQLIFNEKEYHLTVKQYKTLKLLLKNSNMVLSPVDIYYHLNPMHNSEYSNASVRNIVKRLRTILPEGVIESIYAEGYRFNVDKL